MDRQLMFLLLVNEVLSMFRDNNVEAPTLKKGKDGASITLLL